MKKLTKENIQFIDAYLKNSNVEYLDIRIEMTDHVASEIEAKMVQGDVREFYEIFKSYMLEHKKGLLKNLKKFKWQATKKAFKQIFINSYQPKTLFLTGLTVLLMFFVGKIFSKYSDDFASLFMLASIMILITYVLKGKIKFSVLHELISITCLLNYFIFCHLLEISFIKIGDFVCATFVVWFNVSCIKSIFDLKLHYKKQFLV